MGELKLQEWTLTEDEKKRCGHCRKDKEEKFCELATLRMQQPGTCYQSPENLRDPSLSEDTFRRLLKTYLLWLPYGIGQVVIFLPCGFFFYLLLLLSFSLPNLTQLSQIGCLPYFHTWCGLSANLSCRSETCCMQLAENTVHDAKNRHLGTITQLCRAISSKLRLISTSGKKLVKQQYLPHVFTIW